MGMADFYITLILHNEQAKMIESKYLTNPKYAQIFSLKIFDLENEQYKCKIVSECAIDNFLPTCIIFYDLITSISFKDEIDIESSDGVIQKFNFKNEEEFMNLIFTTNKTKIRTYFNQLGMLIVNREKYYKQRKKYEKHYIKYSKK